MKFLMKLFKLFKNRRRSKNDIEVLYNRGWGGFEFSDEAMKIMQPWFNGELSKYGWGDESRTEPRIVGLYKEKGSEFMSGHHSCISLAKVPSDAASWWIDEYDGAETVYYIEDGERYEAWDDNAVYHI